MLAAAFALPAQTAISEIHWWGGHLQWSSPAPPPDGPPWFQVGIWSHVPAGTGDPAMPWDRPGTLLWMKSVRRADLSETSVGCAPNHDGASETSELYRYDLQIPEPERFQSAGGGSYWLSVASSGIDSACACDGDVVAPSGGPNAQDAAFINSHVGCTVGAGDSNCDVCDVNCDGAVDSVDVAVVSQCQALEGWANPACCMPPTEFPWGWITRDTGGGAAAVAITSPTVPQVGAVFLTGTRVTDSGGAPWKLAFVLNGSDGSRFVPSPPLPEPNGLAKNRYVSFAAAPDWNGREIAVRVRMLALDRFPAFNGQSQWVGASTTYAENPTGTFIAAPLGCAPHFASWTTSPAVHVYGPAVVPMSAYEIQAVDRSCESTLADEGCYSSPLLVQTCEWADVVSPFGGASQPNFGDVNALVEKFKSVPTSIPRVRAQLRPNVVIPGNNVSFLDVSLAVGAFQGQTYPFAGPSACP